MTMIAEPRLVDAELALRAKPLIEARAKAQQGARNDLRENSHESQSIRTDESLADIAGVSSNTIRKVERIKESAAPELIAAVRTGDASINAAADPRPLAIDSVAEHFQSLLSSPAVQACPGILELLSTVGAALVLRLPQSDDPCEVFPEIEAAFQARRARGRQPRDVFTRWLREQVEHAGGNLTSAQVRALLADESARPDRWVLSVYPDVVYRSDWSVTQLYPADLSQRLYRARKDFRKRHNASRCGD